MSLEPGPAVATGFLGLVECGVGDLERKVECRLRIVYVEIDRRGAHRAGDRKTAAADFEFGGPDPLGQDPAPFGGIGHIGIGDQPEELLAAPACQHVFGAGDRPQYVGEFGQHAVADRMAETVVDALETVEIYQHQQRRSPSKRRGRFGLEHLANRATVAEPGEFILDALPVQQCVGLAQRRVLKVDFGVLFGEKSVGAGTHEQRTQNQQKKKAERHNAGHKQGADQALARLLGLQAGQFGFPGEPFALGFGQFALLALQVERGLQLRDPGLGFGGSEFLGQRPVFAHQRKGLRILLQLLQVVDQHRVQLQPLGLDVGLAVSGQRRLQRDVGVPPPVEQDQGLADVFH